MEIVTHKLANPKLGESSLCECGETVDYVSIDTWVDHVQVIPSDVVIVIQSQFTKSDQTCAVKLVMGDYTYVCTRESGHTSTHRDGNRNASFSIG